MQKTTSFCDLCSQTNDTVKNCQVNVIFTTDQTEGRSTAPYFSQVKMDICKACKDRALTGDTIWAAGAMGYNNYSFKEK